MDRNWLSLNTSICCHVTPKKQRSEYRYVFRYVWTVLQRHGVSVKHGVQSIVWVCYLGSCLSLSFGGGGSLDRNLLLSTSGISSGRTDEKNSSFFPFSASSPLQKYHFFKKSMLADFGKRAKWNQCYHSLLFPTTMNYYWKKVKNRRRSFFTTELFN